MSGICFKVVWMEGRKMNRDLVDNYIEIELIIVEFRR
jgi:hypothetical protein